MIDLKQIAKELTNEQLAELLAHYYLNEAVSLCKDRIQDKDDLDTVNAYRELLAEEGGLRDLAEQIQDGISEDIERSVWDKVVKLAPEYTEDSTKSL